MVMARHQRRALLTAIAAVVPLVVAGMPVTAAATRTRIRCHDGVLGATVVAKGKTFHDDQSCDVDQTRDGKCMFDFVLLDAGSPCCGGHQTRCRCPTKVVRVRVRVHGRRVVKTRLFGKLLLRCLPPAHTGPCAGPVNPTVHLSTTVQPILDRSCPVAGCHSGPMPAQQMDLSAGKTFSSTVEVPSTEKPTQWRIKPGDPDYSYLVQKVEGTPGISGVQDPPGCPGAPLNGAQCLSADDIAAIRQWVTECALNN